jgi:hypothetical protein
LLSREKNSFPPGLSPRYNRVNEERWTRDEEDDMADSKELVFSVTGMT